MDFFSFHLYALVLLVKGQPAITTNLYFIILRYFITFVGFVFIIRVPGDPNVGFISLLGVIPSMKALKYDFLLNNSLNSCHLCFLHYLFHSEFSDVTINLSFYYYHPHNNHLIISVKSFINSILYVLSPLFHGFNKLFH